MIDAVITRLQDRAGDIGLKLVEGVAEYQALVEQQKNPLATPAAYVVPMAEKALGGTLAGDDIQKFGISVGILLVVRNLADARGNAARQDLQVLRDGVKLALLGYAPAAGYAALTRGDGHLMALRDGHLWWQDIYQSSFYERKPA